MMVDNPKAAHALNWRLLASIAAVAGILTVASTMLIEFRQHVGLRAEENARNVVRTVARDISRNVQIIDLSLLGLVEALGREDVAKADPRLRHLIFFNKSASHLGALVVFDADGILTIDGSSLQPRSIQPVVDRDYFKAQVAADRGLFISRPYRSRLIGKDVIGFSRRIGDGHGAFAGVALATIEVSYITDLVKTLDLGPGAVVNLIRDDGALLLRRADTPSRTEEVASPAALRQMQDRSAGSFVHRSVHDGNERLYVFSRLAGLPLTLVVGLATKDVYSDWNGKALGAAIVLGAIAVALVVLTWLLTAELRARTRTENLLVAANAELSRLAVTDPLTGLGNRRHFDERMGGPAPPGTRRSLILLDVDHFKLFNDLYGHQAGDRTLRSVAEIIGSQPCDLRAEAFRVGGEEFALVVDGDLDRAASVAEATRMRVRDLAIAHGRSPVGVVTASLGIAEIGPGAPSEVFARADAALYRAKEGGRDRVVVDRLSRWLEGATGEPGPAASPPPPGGACEAALRAG